MALVSRLFGVAIATLALAGCSESGSSPSHVGYVEVEWVYVPAPSAGWIRSRPVDAGAHVAPGDLLFTLDDQTQQAASTEARSKLEQAQAQARDMATGARAPEVSELEARLQQARAQSQLAEVQNDRVAELGRRGFASNQQVDEAEAAYHTAQAAVRQAEQQIATARLASRPAARDAARANVEAARAASASAEYQLGQRVIRSETNAEVAETFLNPGEYATAGNPVLALLPSTGMKVHFFVSEAELPLYPVGTSVQIQADGLSEAVAGQVSFVAPDAEFTPPVIYSRDSRQKLVFLVKVDVPADSGLRPGLPVDVVGP